MSTHVRNPHETYEEFQERMKWEWSDDSDSITDEFDVEREDELKKMMIDEEYEDDEDYEDYEDDEEFDSNYDSDTDDENDHQEYLDDEDSDDYRNNYTAKPGYFYPEQPYIGLPVVPKPSSEASTSKFNYYILSPICDIVVIYIKFAILAILIYACALWYSVYYGDLSSIATDMDNDDADTCPAN